jgi:hypothetical protein
MWWEQNGPKIAAIAFGIIISLISTIYLLLRSDVNELKIIAKSIEHSITTTKFEQIGMTANTRIVERDIEELRKNNDSQWQRINELERELNTLKDTRRR